jgi:hypothetical protein
MEIRVKQPILPVQLAAGVSNYVRLRERLKIEIPGLDDVTLADTLEGITDLREIVGELVRSALVDEALSGGLSTRLAEMRARLQRLGDRAEKKRALALRAMSEADIKTLVLAAERIPSDYWRPQPPKLDRLGLLAALKGGSAIDGAAIVAPELQLSVRTK